MATIVLIRALPALRLASRESLARALKLLEGSLGQDAGLTWFSEYFPRLGGTNRRRRRAASGGKRGAGKVMARNLGPPNRNTLQYFYLCAD